MNAVILSVGSELTRGEIVDTNAAFLARELAELGIPVERTVQLGDDRAAIAEELRKHPSNLILMTGGLGPTRDDVTRQAIADALQLRLIEHAESLRLIEERFRRRNIPMPSSNRTQAQIPEGSTLLPNSEGTAVGFFAGTPDGAVAVMPGVPSEMKTMWRDHLKPLLRERYAGSGALRTRSLRCFGEAESAIDEKVADLFAPGRNPSLGLLVDGGVVSVKFTARGATLAEAEDLIDRSKAVVRERLGATVFGDDDDRIEDAVARLLEQRRRTVATAESCTAELVAAMLANVPGVSRFFLGGIVAYDNKVKTGELGVSEEMLRRAGAVSGEVAAAMADGVRERLGADIGLGITGIAGPGGGTEEKPVGLVYLALSAVDGTTVRRCRFHGERNFIRRIAANSALNLLRLQLSGQLQA
ncbi:MAG: competence/damage-inducible protein A [Planctomycetes bacterium RBG_16_59_8]|nr:MAG: competence/damage-inducible protein A [Planctomycetes bacterium RBG_16_59_8]